MDEPIVRFERISIDDLKNVHHGEISFLNPRRQEGASVLGLYGQNGSGKSTLIDALEMTGLCMRGSRLSGGYAQLISADASHGAIKCELSISRPSDNEIYHVVYSFKIEKDLVDYIEDDSKPKKDDEEQFTIHIYDERLAMSIHTPDKISRMTTFIDTSAKLEVFEPAVKFQELVGNNSETFLELSVEKRLANRESRSFIFSNKLIHAIREKHKEEDDASENARYAIRIIEALNRFARFQLFILNASDAGLLSINELPFSFRIVGSKTISGRILLPMEGTRAIPERFFEPLNSAFDNMNIVLRELIPGLEVSMHQSGTEVLNNGETGIRVQLISKRGETAIPLGCESEGIKRIVSFLHLLILMFNDPSVTTAIDEIDSGVFEYLLGELLGIVSEHGQGQLIFTSHNLRPLETIDRGFIAFTTTNRNNRYIRMSKVKASNNLRDFYYRDIVLGGQKETLYEPTHNGEIELAFIEAGAVCEE